MEGMGHHEHDDWADNESLGFDDLLHRFARLPSADEARPLLSVARPTPTLGGVATTLTEQFYGARRATPSVS